MNSLFALNALNFFMADVQGGLGPFLGVFLQARHWSPAEIGIVMTIGGIAGMVVTTPIGALVDWTYRAAAALAGVSGYFFGLGAVFAILSIMALLSIGATVGIDPRAIDYRAARGAAEMDRGGVGKFSVLFRSKELMVLGATLTLFHLGNAAMLPLLGQAGVAHDGSDPSALTAATIVIAQTTMVPMALLAARLAEQRGYWVVFLLAR
jgi:hypothetical protein